MDESATLSPKRQTLRWNAVSQSNSIHNYQFADLIKKERVNKNTVLTFVRNICSYFPSLSLHNRERAWCCSSDQWESARFVATGFRCDNPRSEWHRKMRLQADHRRSQKCHPCQHLEHSMWCMCVSYSSRQGYGIPHRDLQPSWADSCPAEWTECIVSGFSRNHIAHSLHYRREDGFCALPVFLNFLWEDHRSRPTHIEHLSKERQREKLTAFISRRNFQNVPF